MKNAVLNSFVIAVLIFSAAFTSCKGKGNSDTKPGNNIENVEEPNRTDPTNDAAHIVALTPSEIGEFAANSPEEEGAYGYKAASNGKFYHFVSYVTGGDSQWDGMYYKEKFTASSSLAPQGNVRYGAGNLQNNSSFGGDRSVAWCEGAKGYGIGERVNMCVTTLGMYGDDKVGFCALMIVNGYAKDQTAWKNNSRVKILRLYVGDTHWCDLHLKDVIKPQIFNFPDHLYIYPHKSGKKVTNSEDWESYGELPSFVYQTELTFEIIEVYPGDKFDDTCITGIALDGFSGVY